MNMTTAAGVLFLAKDTGRCLFQLRKAEKTLGGSGAAQ